MGSNGDICPHGVHVKRDCLECRNAWKRAWNRTHKEKRAAYMRGYQARVARKKKGAEA